MTNPAPPPKPQIKPYLSVVQGRTPVQKAHNRLSDAKNAVVQWPKRNNSRGYWDNGTYVYEEIDGIRTGRKKYVKAICGGQIWEWDADTSDWKLIYDIPEHVYEHQVPWKAEEYQFYVEN